MAGNTTPEPPWAEGIPDHLDVPITQWLYEVLRKFGMAEPVVVRLRLSSTILKNSDPSRALATFADRKNPMLRLEIIDATLSCVAQSMQGAGWLHWQNFQSQYVRHLSGVLNEGNSAFTVSEDGCGLELRIDEALHANFDKAVETGQSAAEAAADHLRAAFSDAYGIKPSPSHAYSHAVKAVEAVANPLFLPNHPRPTLGLVRAHLDQGRNKYEMVIADENLAPAGIEAAVEMVGLLWHGQRDRHEGGPSSAPVSQEAAEAAVHTAAILVHWMSNGSIRRKQ
jgi:hypothetical protein